MDPSDFPIRPPRRELQGPRPPALKVSKDSHKIKKPPVAPQPSQQQQQQQTQPRPPVIIYTVSPKVIHIQASDFKDLVQRLTGCSSSTCSATSSSSMPNNPLNGRGSSGAISPASRYATIEKAKSPSKEKKTQIGDVGFMEDMEMDQEMNQGMDRSCLFPGILSPGPASLPLIQPNFFSPLPDPSSVSFFHDLSPVLHGNRNFIEGSFMPSPSTFVSPRTTSPTQSIDLFNNFNTFNNFFDF